MAKPVVIMAVGGKPVVNTTVGPAMTPVSDLGIGVTLATVGQPVVLVNADGTTWTP
jgi:hypothetical protein